MSILSKNPLAFWTASASLGAGSWRAATHEMQFPPVEQFPADGFAGFQPDGLDQCVRQIDVEPWALRLGADSLHFEGIARLHGHKIAYTLAVGKVGKAEGRP
jgi:hypothetical protein